MATVTLDEIQRDFLGYLHRVQAGETLVIMQIDKLWRQSNRLRRIIRGNFVLLVCVQVNFGFLMTLMPHCRKKLLSDLRANEAFAGYTHLSLVYQWRCTSLGSSETNHSWYGK